MRKIFTFLFAALMSVGVFATTVTWDSNTLSSILITDGGSFTQDGVTVTSLVGMIYGETGQWMGNSNDASFKFSTSLGNFTKIEITATIHALGGSGWTQTSPGAVWTGEANETTFGEYVSSVSQIVFTIGEPAPTTYTLQLVADPEKGSVAVTNLLGSDIIDNGNGNYTVPENAEVTILATPLESYEFSGWKVANGWCDFTECGTALNTNDNPLTFTMTADVSYLAEFAAVAPADPNREYLSLDPSAWTWGYNSVPEAVAGGIKTTIVSDWGALSMGWDPERDLSEWDKIVFEVSHMEDCAGNWFKLKAYLRDEADSESKQMEGLLGLDAPDNELNYLVIDLHQQVEGFDLTKARVLAVQCEPTGGIFTISSAYLLKENHEGVEEVPSDQVQSTKVLRDGVLYIVRDGKLYNAQGALVK